MRRYGWLIVGLMLIALWAWSQRGPGPVAPGAETAGATHSAHAHAPLAAPVATAPRARSPAGANTPRSDHYPAFLPPEALATLQLIARGGPYPNHQDGATFQNRERLLPPQPRGYYREYTVRTPGSRDRGARRIIAGGDPPVEFFYSDDHYRRFRRFTPAGASP
jgi:ribonuclease T1